MADEEQTQLIVKLAKMEVHLDGLKTFTAQLHTQMSTMESKIDNVTRLMGNDYVRKDDLNTRLGERKWGFMNTQNIIFSLIVCIISVALSFAASRI